MQGDFLLVLESSVDCALLKHFDVLGFNQKSKSSYKDVMVKVFHLNSSTVGYFPKIFLVSGLGWVKV